MIFGRNLLDKDNRIARISCNIFINWAVHRIQAGQTFDRQLNDVAQNLFPEVHPEMWAVALIFVFSPYSPENRIKSIVERQAEFSHFPEKRNLKKSNLKTHMN